VIQAEQRYLDIGDLAGAHNLEKIWQVDQFDIDKLAVIKPLLAHFLAVDGYKARPGDGQIRVNKTVGHKPQITRIAGLFAQLTDRGPSRRLALVDKAARQLGEDFTRPGRNCSAVIT